MSVAVGSVQDTLLLHLPASAITVISEGHPVMTGGVVSLGRVTVTVLVIKVLVPEQPILPFTLYSIKKVVSSLITLLKIL